MGPFGDRLKRERELRGISLDEISSATKIGTRSLLALEEEDFAKLPGGVFNRGFVRAYAKFLGINPEEAVADYLEAAGEEDVGPKPLQPPEPGGAGKMRAPHRNAEVLARTIFNARALFTQLRWTPLLILAVLLAIFAGGASFYARSRGHIHERILTGLSRLKARAKRHQSAGSGQVQPQAASTPSNTASVRSGGPGVSPAVAAAPAVPSKHEPLPGPAPEGSAQRQPTPATAPPRPATASDPDGSGVSSPIPDQSAKPGEFTLLIRAKEQSWISLVVDGQPPVRRMLHSGDPDVTITAHRKIKLTAGSAAAIELSLNGKALPAFGTDQQTRTVLVTAAGIQAIQ